MSGSLQLYGRKIVIFTDILNKWNIQHDRKILDTQHLIDKPADETKTHCKEFLTHTIKFMNHFLNKSTKVFTSSDHYIYTNILHIWNDIDDESRALCWKYLYELLFLSIRAFPVFKTTDRAYGAIIIQLTKAGTDIQLPKLPALDVVSGCIRDATKQIKMELENGTISEKSFVSIVEEIQPPSGADMLTKSGLLRLKTKTSKIMEREECRHVLELIRGYFNDDVVTYLKTEFGATFDSDKYKTFSKKYKNKRDHIMEMLLNADTMPRYARQLIEESGIDRLLGIDFAYPSDIADVVGIVEKYSNYRITDGDIKEIMSSKGLLANPNIKNILSKLGIGGLLDGVIGLLGADPETNKDTEKERIERRRNKRFKKMMREERT